MKQHLFNSLTVSMISSHKDHHSALMSIFFDVVEDCGFEVVNVYKPSCNSNMKLLGADEEDFNEVLSLTKEMYSVWKFNQYIQGL